MQTSDGRATDRDRRRVLWGSLILLVLLSIAVMIISLERIAEARTTTIDVAASLPGSGGLGAGAPVWIAGHEVGEVVSVALLPAGAGREGSRIVAIARMPEEYLPLLRTDSRARLTSAQLMGPAILAISPGSAAAAGLEPGDTIPAAYEPDQIDEAVARTRGVLGGADTLLAQLRAIGALYQGRRPGIEALQRSAAEASLELERAKRTLAYGPMSGALGDARLAERVQRVRAAVTELQRGLGRYTAGSLGTDMEALGARADALGEELAALDSATADLSGFLGRYAADTAISRQAARAAAQMDSLRREAMSNPFMFF